MKICSFIAALLLSAPAFAAVAPYYESARVLKAVLENETLVDKLGVDQTIQKIERFDRGYRVTTTSNCSIDVTVVYSPIPPGFAGLTPFKLRVAELYCYGG